MVFRFIRPDSEIAWRNGEILKRFSKYKAIIDNTGIARYLIAKSIPVKFSPESSLEDLENLLRKKTEEFNELLKEPVKELKSREVQDPCLLDLAKTIAIKYLDNCNFCERRCGISRNKEEKGFCLLTNKTYVSSAFLHMGEESVLVPSGTIFFQGCNFACVFCQNYDISQAWKGKRDISEISQEVNEKTLARIADGLAEKGALNINYVGGDPIPNIHTIIGSLKYQSHNICQLWNSNFYCTRESLSLIINFMDFWLPDFKYGNNECAEKYSGVKNYYDVLTRNLKIIHDEGSGEIIIRHLVMPNHVECCSIPILEYIATEIPKCVVNIMGQYRPEYHAYKYSEINRRPSSEEMLRVKAYAKDLGILYEPVL